VSWKTYEELKAWGITKRLKECKCDVRKAAESLNVSHKTIYNVLGAKQIQTIREKLERTRKKA
jgi:transcriptional regulator with AAA-type ATPase domain